MSDEPIPDNVQFAEDVAASLPVLEQVARPEGQSEEYQFFTNSETGQAWKAKLSVQDARPANVVATEEVAAANLAITVTVSPVDEAGKAMRENDKPIVIDSLTHTFNEVEMTEEGFDPKVRIMQIVADRIKLGEARLAGVNKLHTLLSDWKK